MQGRHFASRVSAAVAIQLTLFALVFSVPEPAAAQDCDRDCLGDIMSAYLESLVANDPSIAPMADDVREQVAAVHAVMEEQGTQILFAARLQVEALSYECIQQGVLSAIARCAEYEDRGRNLPGCPPYICRDWANR